MDYDMVIDSEGYRIEDLKPEHQTIIKALREIEFDMSKVDYEPDCDLAQISRTLEKIILEIGEDVKAQFMDVLHGSINEYQIYLAEKDEE